MKIQINIDPQNSSLVTLMTRLLSNPALWKWGTSHVLDGPHGIALSWDNLPWYPNLRLVIDGEEIENIGFFDGVKIRREANKVHNFLWKVRELEQEKAHHEKISRILEKVNAASHAQ